EYANYMASFPAESPAAALGLPPAAALLRGHGEANDALRSLLAAAAEPGNDSSSGAGAAALGSGAVTAAEAEEEEETGEGIGAGAGNAKVIARKRQQQSRGGGGGVKGATSSLQPQPPSSDRSTAAAPSPKTAAATRRQGSSLSLLRPVGTPQRSTRRIAPSQGQRGKTTNDGGSEERRGATDGSGSGGILSTLVEGAEGRGSQYFVSPAEVEAVVSWPVAAEGGRVAVIDAAAAALLKVLPQDIDASKALEPP
ncbi:unnamed protein product, partial [Symbiodinium sp. KB8]